MTDYIPREAVLDFVEPDARPFLAERIKSIPAADVRPVKRGEWKDAMQSCNDSPHVKCSVCGEYYWRYFKKFNFCPNCGAVMEES